MGRRLARAIYAGMFIMRGRTARFTVVCNLRCIKDTLDLIKQHTFAIRQFYFKTHHRLAGTNGHTTIMGLVTEQVEQSMALLS